MKDISFNVGSLEFEIRELLGKSRGDGKMPKLLNYIKFSDPSHEVYKPIDDDIENDNDKWEVYMAFNDSFIIEFLEDKLIYIAFDLRFLDKEVISLPTFANDINSIEDLDIEGELNHDEGYFQTIIDSDIVLALILEEHEKEKVKVVAFGDLNVFSNEKKMPNRYSEILGSLGKFTV